MQRGIRDSFFGCWRMLSFASCFLLVGWPLCLLISSVYYCVGQLAGSRPGGRGTFLARPRKVPKRRPPLLLATLRVAKGNLCRGICGVCRETHYALKALRSDRRGKLDDEALALFGANATPQRPRPRRMQKGVFKNPNSQQPTANSQQPTANSQQPTANSQQPTANSLQAIAALGRVWVPSAAMACVCSVPF